MTRSPSGLRSWLFLGVAAAALTPACSDRCERQSDCERGFLCTSGGECVPATSGGLPIPLPDLGVLDAQAPDADAGVDAGIDLGTPDMGRPDASPDAGLAADAGDAGPFDGAVVLLDDELEVVVREVLTASGVEVELEGRLRDLSAATYAVESAPFPNPTGNCVVDERRLVSGAPIRLFAAGIGLQPELRSEVRRRLLDDGTGRYVPSLPSPMRWFLAMSGEPVTFEVEAAQPGSPQPALAGLPVTRVTSPASLDGIAPPPMGPGIPTRGQVTFVWTPSPLPEVVWVEARTAPEPDLVLACASVMPGLFILPAAAREAFEARRRGRPAALYVLRRSLVRESIERVGGGLEPIELRVERGARYELP